MEEEKLMQLISVQELLDDEDEEAFNVCIENKSENVQYCKCKINEIHIGLLSAFFLNF